MFLKRITNVAHWFRFSLSSFVGITLEPPLGIRSFTNQLPFRPLFLAENLKIKVKILVHRSLLCTKTLSFPTIFICLKRSSPKRLHCISYLNFIFYLKLNLKLHEKTNVYLVSIRCNCFAISRSMPTPPTLPRNSTKVTFDPSRLHTDP